MINCAVVSHLFIWKYMQTCGKSFFARENAVLCDAQGIAGGEWTTLGTKFVYLLMK